MTHRFAILLPMLSLSLASHAEIKITGDVNGDGSVTLADVKPLVEMVAGKQSPTNNADIDKDGRVSIRDVAILIRMLNDPDYSISGEDIPIIGGGDIFDVKEETRKQ